MKNYKRDEYDVIYGFDDIDMLKINENFTVSYDSAANTITFNIDSTANVITLKDFTTTTFNVNKIRLSNQRFKAC